MGIKWGGVGGQLSSRAIKKIQGHYGATIRNNVNNMNNVSKMKRDIWAIWEHRARKHDDCSSWCPSKQNPPGDPNKNALHPHVSEAIKPVFETLTNDTLLNKCAHGGTQNTNESFYNIIWARCPKTSFVGRSRLCLAVADATIVYNDGETGRLPIFTELGMIIGHHTTTCFRDIDKIRITGSRAQATPAAHRERQRRAVKDFYLSGAH